jgi:hypothetical protein
MRVAARIVRAMDRVRVVTVRAGGRVLVSLIEEQLTVPAGSQLGDLVGRDAVLPHQVDARVAPAA